MSEMITLPNGVQATYEDYLRVLDAKTYEEACGHITRVHGIAVKHLTEALTDMFILGAAVGRAQVFTSGRKEFLVTISATTGIREDILRRSLGLYRTFGGKLKDFFEWRVNWMEENGKLLLHHVDDLIAVNRERASVSENVDRYNNEFGHRGEEYRFEDVARRYPLQEARFDRKKESPTPKEEARNARARMFSDLRRIADQLFLSEGCTSVSPVPVQSDVEGEILLPGGIRARVTIALCEVEECV